MDKKLSATLKIKVEEGEVKCISDGSEELLNYYCLNKALEILEQNNPGLTTVSPGQDLLEQLKKNLMEQKEPGFGAKGSLPKSRKKKEKEAQKEDRAGNNHFLHIFLSLLEEYNFKFEIQDLNYREAEDYLPIRICDKDLLISISRKKIRLLSCENGIVISRMAFYKDRLMVCFKEKVEAVLQTPAERT